ncbi:MAG: DUF4065 domain-containing protein [Firmicutes bacterium]|nr:DUF4065 domain-containing protein [Bacillota bacterium]
MNKTNVFDYTKWFLENNLDTPRNTFKGNMKLQKLLFFAQLISLAKNNKLLFDDQFCAFENGMVMENVRLKYKNNLDELLNYRRNKLTDEELEILELTKNIYGSENADTLSNMTHQFEYWKKYLQISNNKFDFKDKNKSLVPNEELEKELDNIRDVLDAYNIMNSEEFKSMEELDY